MSSTRNSSRSGKKLRLAFIGAGAVAGTHMSLLAEMKDVELVALADVNEASMTQRAQQHKVPQCFTDYRKMLAEVRPQAVSVCTPNGLHAEAAIAAADAGAHVLVEKPMAMNARQAQAMIDAAKRNKTKLVIGFQYRYSPRTQFLRRQMEQGCFGKVLYARVQALRRRGIPSWGVFGRKELQGGGPMIDIGVHALEMAHFAMGAPRPIAAVGSTFTYLGNKKPRTYAGWGPWDYKTYTVEDLAVGQIRFDNGAVLSIESSFVAHIKSDVLTFDLMGEKAGATWSPLQLFTDQAGYMVDTVPAVLPKDDFMTNFGAKLRNFVDHALYNKPTMAPAEHGLMVQKMLDGIYESAEKGREVTID